ncbi:unnamed protein product [Microthlaspi erraticum]|uniref:Uncharacterized protein n=1 Tax=Microthlaspi erraticum TaxID=1685480 RepID=A0A6D2INH6_9BRAS|nr:unnamed protein product [Microthlaspi erraticum]
MVSKQWFFQWFQSNGVSVALGFMALTFTFSTTGCGVLRGSARPKIGDNINMAAFYGVGIPVGIVLTFWPVRFGFMGLWLGMLAAQIASNRPSNRLKGRDLDHTSKLINGVSVALGFMALTFTFSTTGCGVLRGSARLKIGANINMAAFYGVGIPVGIVLTFWPVRFGFMGLWLGMLAAQIASNRPSNRLKGQDLDHTSKLMYFLLILSFLQ